MPYHEPLGAAPPPPADVQTVDAEMDGLGFAALAADLTNAASTYMFGGVGPVVRITPVLYFESRRKNGTEAIHNSLTGAINAGRSPFERTL